MQGETKRHKSVISMQDDDVQLFGEEEEGNSKLAAFGKKWRVRQPGTTSFMGIAKGKEIYAIMLVEGDDQVIVNLLDRTRYEVYLQGPDPGRGKIVEDPKWEEVFDRLAKLKYCPAVWAKGRRDILTFSEWLDWSQLYALTERVEETVFEDGREKQRGRVMPLRHLSLLLYYWAYVRSVRLYGIFKGTYLGYTEAVNKALEKAKNLRKGFPLEIKCIKSDDNGTHLWHLLYGKTFQDRLNREPYVSIQGEAGGYQRGYLPAQFYFVEARGFSMDCSLFRTFLVMPEFHWACYAWSGTLKSLTMFNSQDTECYFIVDCATNLEKVVLHGDPERSTHSEPKTTEKKNIRSEDLLGVNLSVNRQKGEDSLDILQLQELDVRGFPQLQVLPTKDVCRTQMPFISTCIFENIRTRQGCESLEVVLSGLAQRDVSKVNRRKGIIRLPSTLAIGDCPDLNVELIPRLMGRLPKQCESLSLYDLLRVERLFDASFVTGISIKQVTLKNMPRLSLLDIQTLLSLDPEYLELSHLPQINDSGALTVALSGCKRTSTVIFTALTVVDFTEPLSQLAPKIVKLGIVDPVLNGRKLTIPFRNLLVLKEMIGVIAPPQKTPAGAGSGAGLPFDAGTKESWIEMQALTSFKTVDDGPLPSASKKASKKKEAELIVSEREQAAELSSSEQSSAATATTVVPAEPVILQELDDTFAADKREILIEKGLPLGIDSEDLRIPPWFPQDMMSWKMSQGEDDDEEDDAWLSSILTYWCCWATELHDWLTVDDEEGVLFYPKLFGDNSDERLVLQKWDDRDNNMVNFIWNFDRNIAQHADAIKSIAQGFFNADIVLKHLPRVWNKKGQTAKITLAFNLRNLPLKPDRYTRADGVELVSKRSTMTDRTLDADMEYVDNLFGVRIPLGRVELTDTEMTWKFHMRGMIEYLALQCFAHVCTYSNAERKLDKDVKKMTEARRKKLVEEFNESLDPVTVRLRSEFVVKSEEHQISWPGFSSASQDECWAAINQLVSVSFSEVTHLPEFRWTPDLSARVVQIHQGSSERIDSQGYLLLVYLQAVGLWSLSSAYPEAGKYGLKHPFWRAHVGKAMKSFFVRAATWITAIYPVHSELFVEADDQLFKSLKKAVSQLERFGEPKALIFRAFVERNMHDIRALLTDEGESDILEKTDTDVLEIISVVSRTIDQIAEYLMKHPDAAQRAAALDRSIGLNVDKFLGILFGVTKAVAAARNHAVTVQKKIDRRLRRGDNDNNNDNDDDDDEDDDERMDDVGFDEARQVAMNADAFFQYLQDNMMEGRFAGLEYQDFLDGLEEQLGTASVFVEEIMGQFKVMHELLKNENFDARVQQESEEKSSRDALERDHQAARKQWKEASAPSPEKLKRERTPDRMKNVVAQVPKDKQEESPPKQSDTKRFKFREEQIEVEGGGKRTIAVTEPLMPPARLIATTEQALDNRRAQATFEGLRDIDAILGLTAPLPGNADQVVVPATPSAPSPGVALVRAAEAAAEAEKQPVLIKTGRGKASDPFVLESQVYG